MPPSDTTTDMTVACLKLGCTKKFSTLQDLASHQEEDHSHFELDPQPAEKTSPVESVSGTSGKTAEIASDFVEKHSPIESLEVKHPTLEGDKPNLNDGELSPKISISNPSVSDGLKNQSSASSLGKPAEWMEEEDDKRSFAVKYPTRQYNRLAQGHDPRYLEWGPRDLSIREQLGHSSSSDEESDEEPHYVFDSKRC